MALPLVSILIPAFNAEHWIAETIVSAQSQTWPRKEIIVVDDGSRDRTKAIAKGFAGKDLVVTTQPNQGAAAARNYAYSLCQGDYIQWLDADDLLSSDKIEKQMDHVERGVGTRTLLSSSWGRFMHRPARAIFMPTALWQDLSPVEWLLHKMDDDVWMQTSTWLTSRYLAEAAGPWNAQTVADDDGEYFCRVLVASHGTRFVPEAKVYYRVSGPGSLSYIGRSNTKMEGQLLSTRLHIGYLRSLEDSERVRRACLNHLQRYLAIYDPLRPDLVRAMEDSARELGGQLHRPRLPAKYAWIEPIAGRSIAKRVHALLPAMKRSVLCALDKILRGREGGKTHVW